MCVQCVLADTTNAGDAGTEGPLAQSESSSATAVAPARALPTGSHAHDSWPARPGQLLAPSP